MAFLNKKISRGPDRQRGVGMIEVLIAITISAFALLGLAGLQVAALRYQKVANFRSLASQYGADIGDRIRANAAGANAGNYTAAGTYPGNATAAACAVSNACTAAELATRDIYNWRLSLSKVMAGGWGTVSGSSAAGFVVTVYFNEPDKTGTDSGCNNAVFPSSFSASDKAAVRCFLTVVTP